MIRTWLVYALDVWGNPEDGFTVNDRNLVVRVEFDDDGTEDQKVLDVLAASNLVGKNLRANVDVYVSDFDWGPGGHVTINIDRSEDEEPLLTLETEP